MTGERLVAIEVPEFRSIDSIELFFRRNAPLSAAATEFAAVLRREAQRIKQRRAIEPMAVKPPSAAVPI